MKKKYEKQEGFFMLPNDIFKMDLDPYAFMIYAYLVSCAGAKGESRPCKVCNKNKKNGLNAVFKPFLLWQGHKDWTLTPTLRASPFGSLSAGVGCRLTTKKP